jgi:flagellar hook assembly protein FlgD
VDPTSDSDEVLIPAKLTLYQNFPNPFNPTTNIAFSVPEASMVSIKVYNIKGQLVRNLLDEYTSAGTHTIQWHGDNDLGRAIGSGIYFIKISDETSSVIRKAVLLK